MLEIFLTKSNSEGTPITQDLIASSVCEFNYNPDEERTFFSYYRCDEDVFRQNCLGWTNKRKLCLL